MKRCSNKEYCKQCSYIPSLNVELWNRLNICFERAFESCENSIQLGDINEDQLNPQNHKLNDIMALNNFRNLIACPTRVFNGRSTCIDPIVVSSGIDVVSQGVMDVPNNISVHYSTYAYVKINIHNQSEKTRKVWKYSSADFNTFNVLILNHDWSFLHNGSVDEVVDSFTKSFMSLAQQCIPNYIATIRENVKPWYNSEIRKLSRKRDRKKMRLKVEVRLTGTNICFFVIDCQT